MIERPTDLPGTLELLRDVAGAEAPGG